ncbi:hypothetical protein ACFX2I_022811 [Malus domestica]
MSSCRLSTNPPSQPPPRPSKTTPRASPISPSPLGSPSPSSPSNATADPSASATRRSSSFCDAVTSRAWRSASPKTTTRDVTVTFTPSGRVSRCSSYSWWMCNLCQ